MRSVFTANGPLRTLGSVDASSPEDRLTSESIPMSVMQHRSRGPWAKWNIRAVFTSKLFVEVLATIFKNPNEDVETIV